MAAGTRRAPLVLAVIVGIVLILIVRNVTQGDDEWVRKDGAHFTRLVISRDGDQGWPRRRSFRLRSTRW